MRYRLIKNDKADRPARAKSARGAGFAWFADGSGRRIARHALSALMVLILLMNSFAFAVDDSLEFAGLTTEYDDEIESNAYDGDAEVDLNDGAVDPDVASVDGLDLTLPDDGSAVVTEVNDIRTLTYKLGKKQREIMLSDLMMAFDPPVDMMFVEMVTVLGDMNEDAEPVETPEPTEVPEDYVPEEDPNEELLCVEPLVDDRGRIYDYRITTLKDFDVAGLAVYTEDDMYIIRLTDGKAPEPTPAPTAAPCRQAGCLTGTRPGISAKASIS